MKNPQLWPPRPGEGQIDLDVCAPDGEYVATISIQAFPEGDINVDVWSDYDKRDSHRDPVPTFLVRGYLGGAQTIDQSTRGTVSIQVSRARETTGE